jgi:hypothetical protein
MWGKKVRLKLFFNFRLYNIILENGVYGVFSVNRDSSSKSLPQES